MLLLRMFTERYTHKRARQGCRLGAAIGVMFPRHFIFCFSTVCTVVIRLV